MRSTRTLHSTLSRENSGQCLRQIKSFTFSLSSSLNVQPECKKNEGTPTCVRWLVGKKCKLDSVCVTEVRAPNVTREDGSKP